MIPELEKIVDNQLSKGELSERSRELLIKKAEQLGEDPIDFELELEQKISERNSLINETMQISTDEKQKKTHKEGDIKKCPSCGAPVPSFKTTCEDCGHEFRNIEAVTSLKEIHKQLQEAEADERKKERSMFEKLDGELAVARAVANRKKAIISSFPVPNTKEDILEFLSIASPEAKKKLGFLVTNMHPDYIIKSAWLSKCEQLIVKARLSMKDDKKTLFEIENYAKQLKIK